MCFARLFIYAVEWCIMGNKVYVTDGYCLGVTVIFQKLFGRNNNGKVYIGILSSRQVLRFRIVN